MVAKTKNATFEILCMFTVNGFFFSSQISYSLWPITLPRYLLFLFALRVIIVYVYACLTNKNAQFFRRTVNMFDIFTTNDGCATAFLTKFTNEIPTTILNARTSPD